MADLHFTDPYLDLLERYEEALARDACTIHGGKRYYWTGETAAQDDLMRYLATAVPAMLKRRLGPVTARGLRYESLELLQDDAPVV
jgi:hypothetical protein